jgi:DeoR/GlpR family transcriptional regulator of sugar metabolism
MKSNRNLAAAVSEAVLKAGSRRVADLAPEFGVSEVTIRKILDGLERTGVIRRYHGEARAYDGDAIPFRMGLHYAQKQNAAELAAGLVKHGEAILLEAGSAVACLAERLKSRRGLTIVTPNLFIARIFRGGPVRVVVTGGEYQEESESLVGPLAEAAVRGIGFSKAFLGASGYTTAGGFALNDSSRARLSSVILERGAENYVLTDSSKFGVAHIAPYCSNLSLLTGIVTDPGIPSAFRAEFEAAGLTLLF